MGRSDMLTIRDATTIGAPPWRPVQFLGSKLRSLGPIGEAVGFVTPVGGRVWEPFSGSSVVSQSLASAGYSVWASDALLSSATFAHTLLGVARKETLESALDAALNVAEVADQRAEAGAWASWLELEEGALANQDGAALLRMHDSLPQSWRSQGADPSLVALFDSVNAAAIRREATSKGLISATYAGTYFSLRQALDLEALRGVIDAVIPAKDPWLRNALLTALCHAASLAVYSPGKHFAQPHRVSENKDLTFHAKRALSDRSIDIRQEFLAAARQIDFHTRHTKEGHYAERRLVSDVSSSDLRARDVRTVYADPPYTAQQYSRFYHLLETLTEGVPPILQRVKGSVTRGLYPEGRFLSPFSSRRQAPQAFQALMSAARDADANMIISYSDSVGKATGNARMVSLDDLVGWLCSAYGTTQVSVEQLDFRYRQFNHRDSEVPGREAPEYLIIGGSYDR